MGNYQKFRIIWRYLSWPKFLPIIFCYCSFTWAVQLIRGVVHLDISFICWFRIIFCVFWSSYSWRSWQSRRQGVRKYHNCWSTGLVESFLNMSFILACFFDEVFLLFKSNTFSLETSLLKWWIIRISELSDVRLKEFYCIL